MIKLNLEEYLDNINYFEDIKLLRDYIAQSNRYSSVVYTYGAWDLLHPGHVRFLARAKALGDFLIVGVISDKQIADFKGSDRPIQKEHERIVTVGALRMVDAVISQPIYDPSQQLEILSKVEILTKGDDWEHIPGTETIKRLGGKLVKLGYTNQFSTSKIVSVLSEKTA